MGLLGLLRAPGLSDLACSTNFLFLFIGLDYYLEGEGLFLGGGGR
jgi:hypothetical protein